jgi:ABC-type transport system involved in multi-copper enzyme maturation permease subunit
MFNIALNTFRELIRSRMLVLIMVFSAAVILFSLVLASLSLGQTERLVLDFGLSMIEISGLVAVVFVGGQMLYREIEGRTIYLILSKPVGRKDFILGKFFGFASVLGIVYLAETAVLLGLLFFKDFPVEPMFFFAAGFSYLKLLVTFATILFFSTFASPMLSVLFSLGTFVASHSANAVLDMAMKTKNASLEIFGTVLSVALPNSQALSFPKKIIGTEIPLPIETLASSFLHATVYLALILLFAAVVFERKNFENA